MSYTIEPISLISFTDDKKLKLPRFQRKSTWDKKQKFELCISIFQQYPVGVVIVNREANSSWLLDGRQRRNALIEMRENPIKIYEWGMNYIGFKKSDDESEIIKLYWNKVDRYLEEDHHDTDEDKSENMYDDEDRTYINEVSFDKKEQKKGLKTLLDIILMVHQIKKGVSKWEEIFDFTKYCKLTYAPKRNDYKIDPILLRKFIIDLDLENVTKDSFVDYFIENMDIENESKFMQDVENRWDLIRESIDIINRSENVFKIARIGIITLNNASPLDAQNIFSRVNKGGTQLKAEELLSAKPFWNKEVQVSDSATQKRIEDMYAKLEVSKPEYFVRWDLAATLISSIEDNKLLFDPYEDKKEINLEEVTLGFKLLSSVFEGGMSSSDVQHLETNESIRWDYDIRELAMDVTRICNILLKDEFFTYFNSWHMPIAKLLGNAIALEFVSIVLLDWKERGSPSTSSGELTAFQRNTKILFDRLVFEYVTKAWRGSGDSKLASDIKNWKERIKPIPEENWKSFIESSSCGIYNGQSTTAKSLRPILYYSQALQYKKPVYGDKITYEVDHIMPQAIFHENMMIDQNLKDSLGNLALLAKKDNISKKDKMLKEITDKWLKEVIEESTWIKGKDFEKYSNLANINTLCAMRRKKYLEVFTEKRRACLMN